MNTHSPDSNASPNASPNANPNANTHPDAQHAQARDDRFDAAMRGLHRAALANVSPQARWKFRPALAARPGAEGLAGRWHRGPLLAGLGVAVLAIALGTTLRPPDEQAPPPFAGSGPVADTVPAAVEDDALVLEQDPDFYAWLVSDDAELVAME